MRSEPMTPFQEYIHLSRYARWDEGRQRRETWHETVDRYIDFFQNRFPEDFPGAELYSAIVNMEVMPSMRAMMTAGEALERDEVAAYNCAYQPIAHPRDFDRMMYILMCGTGNGFSVEREYVNKLPVVADEFHASPTTIVVADSKLGWCASIRELIALLYSGQVPKWDTTRVRNKGSRLKIFGGRASGPEPLDALMRFLVATFTQAAGRRLTTLEVHDICCKIAEIVVVGGVRRSALISLSNLTDERLRQAKSGDWWNHSVHRALANNSVAYTEKPDMGVFMREWNELFRSKAGERGLFNRRAAQERARKSGVRNAEVDFGTNPCGEIVLRPHGLCNLSEVIVRSTDTLPELVRKTRHATTIGTFQATLTNFRYLGPEWRKNAEEERLLGVSLTGIMDHPVLSQVSDTAKQWLQEMRAAAWDENKKWAERLGINPSVAITTVKPSGTVSQLVDSASGIHPRYAPYYLRTVRADKKDPLAQFMRAKGFYVEDDVTKPDSGDVFYFPVKAPEHGVFRNDMTALDQLEHYLMVLENWCDHNASITVYYRDAEFLDVGAWVYRNFDRVNGVSFLPHSDHIYQQAPYQEITAEEYAEWEKKVPQGVDWTELEESTDETIASKELACTAGACEIL